MHVQTVQKQKYRRLTEVTNSLTTLMPNLISLLMETIKTSVTPSQAKRAVIAAYWNIRLLIQQAHRTKKFSLADIIPGQLSSLKQELAIRTTYRFFNRAAVKTARYRFQPHTLISATRLQRGAEE